MCSASTAVLVSVGFKHMERYEPCLGPSSHFENSGVCPWECVSQPVRCIVQWISKALSIYKDFIPSLPVFKSFICFDSLSKFGMTGSADLSGEMPLFAFRVESVTWVRVKLFAVASQKPHLATTRVRLLNKWQPVQDWCPQGPTTTRSRFPSNSVPHHRQKPFWSPIAAKFPWQSTDKSAVLRWAATPWKVSVSVNKLFHSISSENSRNWGKKGTWGV